MKERDFSMYQFKDASMENINQLVKISSSWENQLEINGHFLDREYFEMAIGEGDLPPIANANKENYYLMEVYYEEELIGFFDLYFGYPKPDIAWISIMIIDKEKRHHHHGKEALKRIENFVQTKSFKTIGIGVDLKNHSGLMFWTKNGFSQVYGVFGDKEYSADKFAVICLLKELN